MLDAFLGHADESGAEVVLHCERRNVAFYRRHGFQLLAVKAPGDQHLMLRQARSIPPRKCQERRMSAEFDWASQPLRVYSCDAPGSSMIAYMI